MTSLNPVMTIGTQLIEAIRAHSPVSARAAREEALTALKAVRLSEPERRLTQFPHELSGGMRQRVMIAMAIINNPDIIIADEPTTALDVTVQAQILETLLDVKDEVGAAIVLITHDLGVVAGVADRVGVMYAGRFVATGPVDEIFSNTRMPYTAGLLGSIPELDSDADHLVPIPGSPPTLINVPDACQFAPRCPLAESRCFEGEPLLDVTDQPGHLAACHRWSTVAEYADATGLFDPNRGMV